MILVNFFIGLFSLFISPQVYLYYKYPNTKYSLVFTSGFIFSLSMIWGLVLLIHYFKFPDLYLQLFAYFFSTATFISLFINRNREIRNRAYIPLLWLISVLVLFPLASYIGDVFTVWDAVASWNKWAIELSQNQYQPEGTAYPIFIPALLAIMYKMQATSDIWWTAKLVLFIFPIATIFILLNLYSETKKKTFLFILFLLYPFLASGTVISGFVDIPVMLLGTLSLILLYAAEIYKAKKEFPCYIYLALLVAGLSSIVKQPGIAFLIFNFAYITLNYKEFNNKVILFFIFGSGVYLASFMTWFFLYSDNPVENLEYLHKLSSSNETYDLTKFLITPNRISGVLTVVMIFVGGYLYRFKELRQYNSVGFLSGLFFLLGVIIWSSYFSYDGRNSIWVKSFLILLFSINLDTIIEKRIHVDFERFKSLFEKRFSIVMNRYSLMLHMYHQRIYFGFILSVSFLLSTFMLVGDGYVYHKQEIGQSKIGDADIASIVAGILKNKSKCVQVVTPRVPLFYNYYTRDIKDRFIYGTFSDATLIHDCEGGRYYAFGEWELTAPYWKDIISAEENGVISPVGEKDDLIYYIPPIGGKEKVGAR